MQFPVLQIPLGRWKERVEEVEEKILCSGSGEKRRNSVIILIDIYDNIYFNN